MVIGVKVNPLMTRVIIFHALTTMFVIQGSQPSNLALHKPATMSSVYRGVLDSPILATDGLRDTYYAECANTEIGDPDRWWMVDLGVVSVVQEVHILNRDTCESRLSNVLIEVGMTDTEMSVCAFYTGPARMGENVVVPCPCWVTGRYVRLSGGDASRDDLTCDQTKMLTVCEVEVYGIHQDC